MSATFMGVLYVGPILLVVALMQCWSALKQREQRRFPFQDAVMREAGYTLLKRREKIWDTVMQYLFVLPVYPLIMYTATLQVHLIKGEVSWGLLAFVIVSSLGVIAFALYKIWILLGYAHRVRLGYAGEVAVGQALNQLMLQGYHVFHDVPFDGFNVDHLVMGPGGVFAVESKLRTKHQVIDAHQKTHKVRFDGNALYFPNRPDFPVTAALHQARDEARSVSTWLSRKTDAPVSVQAVVALPGWWIEGNNKQGNVWVFNHNQLCRLPPDIGAPRLAPHHLRVLVAACEDRCLRDDLVPQVLQKKPNPLFQEN